jgi:UPF0176 protein
MMPENKDLLCLYAYAYVPDPTQSVTIYSCLEPIRGSWTHLCAEGINAQLSLPADNFYAFKKTVLKHMFYEGNPMEQDDHPS